MQIHRRELLYLVVKELHFGNGKRSGYFVPLARFYLRKDAAEWKRGFSDSRLQTAQSR